MATKKTDTRAGRFYTIEGIEFPSVTTILSAIGKPALIAWAANTERDLVLKVSGELYQDAPTEKMSTEAWITTMQTRLGKAKAHTRELAKAAEIGTQVHALVEWTLKAEMMKEVGPSPAISDKAMWAFSAWERWRKSVNLKPIFIESVVWSADYEYAGTMDLLAEVNGVVTVLDWKTGKAVYPEAFLQNVAYRHAIREMGHADPKQGIILRLPKVESDPEFQAVEVEEYEETLFKTFLSTKTVWEWIHKEEEKRAAKKALEVVTA
jgi:RecB family exonuclease